ncbi:cysteine--tRNA ligase [Paenibacillus contaminans]|uniref:Cysteine--tRNA ligase n=1 Tax=Paenibacillus contaminans TaxID=450362 RepID=A0A329LQJ6_9BACL|nr:cysteine--tRNA ligase [Paenibacillus contaminans]RAV10235.1 cysteine--tRNA ligase [Paenibacillus contaminans]
MSLKVYNTISRTKEVFVPLTPGKVNMYVCGPTVYDYIHIGNARPLIFFDVVRRYLQASGYDVKYVVNFTDVDDKLIRKAEQIGSTVPEVAERFIEAFFDNTHSLGIKDAIHPRVTENIGEIVAFVQSLVDKGVAYESGGDVYFRTSKFPEYGKVSHQNLDELQFGIRVEVGDLKENPQDFVLWKSAKPGEIFWASPWGNGRPGWHIECSAMVHKYLGETIDIHGGGQDLQFPHHECEVAQTESLTGKPMANYWMHNAYLNINNEKMSKSLANGLTVKDILTKTSPQAVRFLMLSTHYRNPLNFSDDSIKQAESGIERLANSIANVKHRLQNAAADSAEVDAELAKAVEAIDAYFRQKMDDDFNTPDAITAMFELAGEANRYLQHPSVTKASLELVLRQFETIDDVIGILPKQEEVLLDEEVERLIAERNEARKQKNWARADEIRNLLTAQGILLEDTPQGLRWRRK